MIHKVKLSMKEIDAEIAAARKTRRENLSGTI